VRIIRGVPKTTGKTHFASNGCVPTTVKSMTGCGLQPHQSFLLVGSIPNPVNIAKAMATHRSGAIISAIRYDIFINAR